MYRSCKISPSLGWEDEEGKREARLLMSRHFPSLPIPRLDAPQCVYTLVAVSGAPRYLETTVLNFITGM
jgi:hypothetical protein